MTKPVDAHDVAHRAREMGAHEQQDFVQQLCGDDVTLVSQVFALLEQSASGAQHWQEAQEDADDWLPNSLLGARLGPYQLSKLLGAGGMGEVYLAERVDAEFQQQVAIKLVRNSLLSDNVRARLRTERQILASLQHPNIATLLDGGTAPDGTPYIVMEYIDGTSIDVFCDRENLTIEQRLQLFCKVCAAVQCAHQNLIVHRDLKPTNILVTDDGEPKLLDFGIAKLLDTQFSPRSVTVTHHDIRILTPAHASPEQIRGESITTSSDIYVLGVLLYELLCGRRPFKLPAHHSLTDLERVVCSEDPLAPSAMIARTERDSPGLMHDLAKCRSSTAQKLKHRLQGDLDNIVLMALRKEPARRYASAEQFANDIQHWLQGHPVIATKDTWRYRSSKFMRRHAFAVGTFSAAAALLIGFSIVTYVQAKNIAKQRDAIAVERTRAEQVSSFLVELFEMSDPSHSRGNELKARDLLDAGKRRVDTMLNSQPTTRAMLLGTIGRVYTSLGLYQEASDTLDKALQARLGLYGENHAEVADALYALGEARLSQGAFDAAQEYLNRALKIQQRLHGVNAVEQAPILCLLAWSAAQQGDSHAAQQQLQSALALYDTHGQYYSMDKAKALAQLGDVLNATYQAAAAEPLFRAVLAMEIPVFGQDHPHVAQVMGSLADSLVSQGKYTEALPIFQTAMDINQHVLGADHPDGVATLRNYGDLLVRVGDYTRAESIYTSALQIDRHSLGEQHAMVGYDHTNLGLVYYERGEYARAAQKFRTALDIFTHSLSSTTVYLASPQLGLGRCLVQLGQVPEALPLLAKATTTITAAMGADSAITKKAQAAWGVGLVAAHRYSEAQPLLSAALPTLENYFGAQASISRETRAALSTITKPTPSVALTAQK